MPYLKLPQRVFNSPIIRYANFADGSFVNLIKLNKPYANGISYAVYETTKNPFCSNGLFKDLNSATEKYERILETHSKDSNIRDFGYKLDKHVDLLTFNQI